MPSVRIERKAEQRGGKEAVALSLDGGLCPGGQPSTAAEIIKEAGLVIHRAGSITEAMLRGTL